MFDDAEKAITWAIGAPSPWRWPRIIITGVVALVGLILWKCTEVVEANEQAYRMMFGRVRFVYYDSGEGGWRKRYKERRVNRRKVRELRKGPLSNQPHLQLQYGEPKHYGPGRYLKIPFSALSFKKMDATPKNINFDVFVEWEGQFRGANQPIQLVVRVVELFLWDLSTQNVEGTLTGIAKELFRQIKEQLGANEYIRNAEEVKRSFIEKSEEEFGHYGAAIERVNIAAAIPQTEGWIANAILQSGNPTASVAVAATLAAQSNGQTTSP